MLRLCNCGLSGHKLTQYNSRVEIMGLAWTPSSITLPDPMRDVLLKMSLDGLGSSILYTRRVNEPRSHWLLETCQDG